MESLPNKLRSGATFALVLASLTLVGSCSSGNKPECVAFLARSRAERQAEAQGASLDKQIDLFVCAMKQEPPDLSLADPIAERGNDAIPVLLQKLKSAKSEVDQHDLVYVFEVMSRKGLLRGKPDVVAAIGDVVDAMKVEQIQVEARERFKNIQINSGIAPTHTIRR